MSFLAGRGGGVVGGGAGGGHGGGWGGRRGGDGHGGEDDEARKALIRSVGAKKRAARRWLIRGLEPPLSLRDYAPGGRYFDHLPPVVHVPPPPPPPVVQAPPPPPADHIYKHDDAEEAALVAQAITALEASIAEMLRRDAEKIEAQMAVFRAHEEAERAAKRARVEDAVVLDDDDE